MCDLQPASARLGQTFAHNPGYNFAGQYGQVSWGPTFAAISLAVFPTLLICLVLNQRVMKGLAAGTLKG